MIMKDQARSSQTVPCLQSAPALLPGKPDISPGEEHRWPGVAVGSPDASDNDGPEMSRLRHR
jgi:hypothetical protein